MRVDVFFHDSDLQHKLDKIESRLAAIETALEKLGVGGASAADLDKIGKVATADATKAQAVADAATALTEPKP